MWRSKLEKDQEGIYVGTKPSEKETEPKISEEVFYKGEQPSKVI